MAIRKVTVTAVTASKLGGHLALGHTKRKATFFPVGVPVALEVELDDEYQLDADGQPVLNYNGEKVLRLQSEFNKLKANPNLRVELVPTAAEFKALADKAAAEEAASKKAPASKASKASKADDTDPLLGDSK